MYKLSKEVILDGVVVPGAPFESRTYQFDQCDNFSLIIDKMVGASPNISITYKISTDNSLFIDPSNEHLIEGLDSTDAQSIRLVLAPFLRFYITNQGAIDTTLRVIVYKQEVAR